MIYNAKRPTTRGEDSHLGNRGSAELIQSRTEPSRLWKQCTHCYCAFNRPKLELCSGINDVPGVGQVKRNGGTKPSKMVVRHAASNEWPLTYQH